MLEGVVIRNKCYNFLLTKGKEQTERAKTICPRSIGGLENANKSFNAL